MLADPTGKGGMCPSIAAASPSCAPVTLPQSYAGQDRVRMVGNAEVRPNRHCGKLRCSSWVRVQGKLAEYGSVRSTGVLTRNMPASTRRLWALRAAGASRTYRRAFPAASRFELRLAAGSGVLDGTRFAGLSTCAPLPVTKRRSRSVLPAWALSRGSGGL